MHRRALIALLPLALVACSSARTYTLEDLPRLVLQKDEAPAGTTLDSSSSGTETLEEFAEDDAVKEKGLREAGFVRAQFQLFITEDIVGRGNKGILANSIALLFASADGAGVGITLIKDAIERDGEDLRALGLPALGDEAFALAGTLQPGLPPGYAFLWRRENVVLGLVLAGDIAGLNENAARDLAAVMDRHAD